MSEDELVKILEKLADLDERLTALESATEGQRKKEDEKIAKEHIEQILKTFNELTPEQLGKIPQLAQLKRETEARRVYVIGYTITHKIAYSVGKAF
jgi:hypothetical protein